jgi:serine/threonine-protein kinase RsbW
MKAPEIAGNTITIPADSKFLVDVDEFVESYLRKNRITDTAIADIAISVSELVNNAVLHGSEKSPNSPIKISVDKTDGKVTITVTDHGGGFDPSDIDDPLAEENLLKETGRGIFIVRSLMDSLNVETSAEGTTVIISKNV